MKQKNLTKAHLHRGLMRKRQPAEQRVASAGQGILVEEQAALALETERGERPVELATASLDSPCAVLALIERVALDPSPDAEKLERVIAMYERAKAKEAELAYNAAKGRILKKLADIKIVKSRRVLCGIEKEKPPQSKPGPWMLSLILPMPATFLRSASDRTSLTFFLN